MQGNKKKKEKKKTTEEIAEIWLLSYLPLLLGNYHCSMWFY